MRRKNRQVFEGLTGFHSIGRIKAVSPSSEAWNCPFESAIINKKFLVSELSVRRKIAYKSQT
jgi:hypothetical protein